MTKSKIEDQKGMKPVNNLGDAMEHIQRVLKYADENGHPPEVVKVLIDTIGDQYNLTTNQRNMLMAGRIQAGEEKT